MLNYWVRIHIKKHAFFENRENCRRERRTLEWILEGIKSFLQGFIKIFASALILWMAGLIFLLFRELFSSIEFVFKSYLQRVWKMLIFCFEFTPYGFVIVAPILMVITKQYGNYIILTIDAIILSICFFTLRRRFYSENSKKQTEG
jgi:hypothetical protein